MAPCSAQIGSCVSHFPVLFKIMLQQCCCVFSFHMSDHLLFCTVRGRREKNEGLSAVKIKAAMISNFAAGFTSEPERKRVGGKKPKLSTTNWDHQTDGWPFWAKLCICLGISPESNSVQTLQRPSFGWGYKPKVLLRAYTHAKSMALYSNTRESGLAAWRRLHLQPQNERCQLIKEHMSPGEITGEHFQSLQ